MASGWNLWVWLECIGVVSECCCKEVYPNNNYYFSLLHLYYIALFFGCIIPISLFIFKMFFHSCYILSWLSPSTFSIREVSGKRGNRLATPLPTHGKPE